MEKRIAPKARKENLVIQELDGEILIYDLNINKAVSLNETSTLVWQLCDGDKTVSEISKSISKKYNSPVNEDLVWLALDQLKKENLIANKEEIVPNFDGMSRREVIRKVGMASLVALPVVTSLIAPPAAAGGSPVVCAISTGCGGPNAGNQGCPCTTSATCNAGLTCRGTPGRCCP